MPMSFFCQKTSFFSPFDDAYVVDFSSSEYWETEIPMALEPQKQELIFMILQFLNENKYKETVHK